MHSLALGLSPEAQFCQLRPYGTAHENGAACAGSKGQLDGHRWERHLARGYGFGTRCRHVANAAPPSHTGIRRAGNPSTPLAALRG